MLTTAGQRHESTQLGPLLDTIRVPRQDRLAVSYHSWLVLAALLLWLPA